MPKVKASDQVATLEQKHRELMNQLNEAKKAAKAEEKARRKKKADIVGSLILAELDANPDCDLSRLALALFQKKLKAGTDRALFGFDPLPKTPKPDQADAPKPPPVAAAHN